MQQYVLGFAFNRFEEVVLIHKNHPEWQKGRLNGVGGVIDESDDSPVEAMQREFYEETDLSTAMSEWRCFCTLGSIKGLESDWQVFCYVTFLTDKDFNRCRTKTDEAIVKVNTLSFLGQHVIENLHWLVPLAKAQWRNELDYSVHII